ncbi:unnamed protein product [Cunninghamella blakesleeana]
MKTRYYTTNKTTIIEEKREEVKDDSEPTTPTSPPPPSITIDTPVNKVQNNKSLDCSSLLKDLLIPKPIDGIYNWGILPEPNTECDSEQQEKIEHFLSLRKSGHSLNEHLQKNKSFRNPRIYAKLVEFVDIDELGSNFPKDQFDPKGFPSSSYIDGILDIQHQLAEEKAQAAKGRTQLAFVPSSSTTSSTSTPTSSSTPPLSKQSMNTSSPSLSSTDKASKLAAAMANAAKIASRIVKPTHPSPQSTINKTSSSTSSTSISQHTNNNNSSISSTSSSSSSHTKRSSHNKWDRSDEKRRHK